MLNRDPRPATKPGRRFVGLVPLRLLSITRRRLQPLGKHAHHLDKIEREVAYIVEPLEARLRRTERPRLRNPLNLQQPPKRLPPFAAFSSNTTKLTFAWKMLKWKGSADNSVHIALVFVLLVLGGGLSCSCPSSV